MGSQIYWLVLHIWDIPALCAVNKAAEEHQHVTSGNLTTKYVSKSVSFCPRKEEDKE